MGMWRPIISMHIILSTKVTLPIFPVKRQGWIMASNWNPAWETIKANKFGVNLSIQLGKRQHCMVTYHLSAMVKIWNWCWHSMHLEDSRTGITVYNFCDFRNMEDLDLFFYLQVSIICHLEKCLIPHSHMQT